MSTSTVTPSASGTRRRLWASRILFIVPVLFLLMDGVMKLVLIKPVVDGMPRWAGR